MKIYPDGANTESKKASDNKIYALIIVYLNDGKGTWKWITQLENRHNINQSSLI